MQSLIQIINKVEEDEIKRIDEVHSFPKGAIVMSVSGVNYGKIGKVLGRSRKGASVIVEFDKKRYSYSFNKRLNENISFLKLKKRY